MWLSGNLQASSFRGCDLQILLLQCSAALLPPFWQARETDRRLQYDLAYYCSLKNNSTVEYSTSRYLPHSDFK